MVYGESPIKLGYLESETSGTGTVRLLASYSSTSGITENELYSDDTYVALSEDVLIHKVTKTPIYGRGGLTTATELTQISQFRNTNYQGFFSIAPPNSDIYSASKSPSFVATQGKRSQGSGFTFND